MNSNMNNIKVINTGLQGNQINQDILDSVMGQLSDGIWENSPGMSKYWRFADIEVRGGEVVIIVDMSWGSGFIGKSDTDIKNYFATKIKQIAYDELDGHNGMWNRTSMTKLDYLTRDIAFPVTISAAYEAYDILKGRKVANKTYASSPEFIARQKAIAGKQALIRIAQNHIARLQAEINAL